jgi:hypothetical protein
MRRIRAWVSLASLDIAVPIPTYLRPFAVRPQAGHFFSPETPLDGIRDGPRSEMDHETLSHCVSDTESRSQTGPDESGRPSIAHADRARRCIHADEELSVPAPGTPLRLPINPPPLMMTSGSH